MATVIELRANLEGVDWEALRQDLIADDFHNGRTTAQLRLSFENSAFVAMGFDGARCIANGRALSDHVGNALIVDVWTQSAYRKRGIGTRIVTMLVEAMPGQHIYLQSDDAVPFYEALGFSRQPEGLSRISGTYLRNETR
jgi:GNAT superfamily N-acetyltransferase